MGKKCAPCSKNIQKAALMTLDGKQKHAQTHFSGSSKLDCSANPFKHNYPTSREREKELPENISVEQSVILINESI